MIIFAQYLNLKSKGGGPVKSINLMKQNIAAFEEGQFVSSSRDAEGYAIRHLNASSDKSIKYFDQKKYFGFYLFKLFFFYYRIIQQDRTVYINGIMSLAFNFMPLLCCSLMTGQIKIVIAPRGELMEGALVNKQKRKLLYIYFIEKFLTTKDTIFHATSYQEVSAIQKYFPLVNFIYNIPNFMTLTPIPETIENKASIVFYSRIVPKKNLLYCFEILDMLAKKSNKDFSFDIWGNEEASGYSKLCRKRAQESEQLYKTHFNGLSSHIGEVFSNKTVFFFPTLGENFGHVIPEALGYGASVVTSEDVPWSNWSKIDDHFHMIPLKNKAGYVAAIEKELSHALTSSETDFRKRSEIFQKYIKAENQKTLDKYNKLFNTAFQ